MSKFKKLIFFNHWHKGDIFVSRGLIKYILNLGLSDKYYYYHGCERKLLADFPQIQSRPISDCNKDMSVLNFSYPEKVYLNTWYRRSPKFDVYQIAFMSLYTLFKSHMDTAIKEPFSPDPIDVLPQVDFNFFEVDHIKHYLETSPYKKKILVSNGACHSGQAANFSLNPAIGELASKYPDILFLVTNGIENPVLLPNVVYTANIINSTEVDLIENGYISTFCDTIVGRSSGAYTYSMLKENLCDPSKTFICLVNEEQKYLVNWAPFAKTKARTITVLEQTPEAVSKAVDQHLKDS